MGAKAKTMRAGIKLTRATPGKRRTAAAATRFGVRRARRDPSVRSLLHDGQVHKRLRTGLGAVGTVYGRVSGRRGANALVDDRRTRRELRKAIVSFRDAANQVQAARARRRRRVAGMAIVTMAGTAGAGALAFNDDLRAKALGLMPGFGEGSSESGKSAGASATTASSEYQGLYPNPIPGAGNSNGA